MNVDELDDVVMEVDIRVVSEHVLLSESDGDG